MQSDINVRAAIDAGNRRFVEAFTRGDAAGVAALYSSDAQLLPLNSDFVNGVDEIRKFWQGAMQMGIRQVQLQTMGVEAEGGNWKLHRDVWNTSQPPQ